MTELLDTLPDTGPDVKHGDPVRDDVPVKELPVWVKEVVTEPFGPLADCQVPRQEPLRFGDDGVVGDGDAGDLDPPHAVPAARSASTANVVSLDIPFINNCIGANACQLQSLHTGLLSRVPN